MMKLFLDTLLYKTGLFYKKPEYYMSNLSMGNLQILNLNVFYIFEINISVPFFGYLKDLLKKFPKYS